MSLLLSLLFGMAMGCGWTVGDMGSGEYVNFAIVRNKTTVVAFHKKELELFGVATWKVGDLVCVPTTKVQCEKSGPYTICASLRGAEIETGEKEKNKERNGVRTKEIAPI